MRSITSIAAIVGGGGSLVMLYEPYGRNGLEKAGANKTTVYGYSTAPRIGRGEGGTRARLATM